MEEEYLINNKYFKEKIQKIVEYFRYEKSVKNSNLEKDLNLNLDRNENEKKEGIKQKKAFDGKEKVKENEEDLELKKVLEDYYKGINEKHDVDKIRKYKEIKI